MEPLAEAMDGLVAGPMAERMHGWTLSLSLSLSDQGSSVRVMTRHPTHSLGLPQLYPNLPNSSPTPLQRVIVNSKCSSSHLVSSSSSPNYCQHHAHPDRQQCEGWVRVLILIFMVGRADLPQLWLYLTIAPIQPTADCQIQTMFVSSFLPFQTTSIWPKDVCRHKFKCLLPFGNNLWNHTTLLLNTFNLKFTLRLLYKMATDGF